jgi:hypothetical protein
MIIVNVIHAFALGIVLYMALISLVCFDWNERPRPSAPSSAVGAYYWLLPVTWVCWLLLSAQLLIWPSWSFDHVLAGVYALIAWSWYVRWKKSKDDRWKKLRKKAKEKISVLGGKLKVVQVPA